MKGNKHIKRFNESDENLNISDVRSSKLSDGYYWIKFKDDSNTSKFFNFSYDGWVIGRYNKEFEDFIFVNGQTLPLKKFELDLNRIER